ncbi:ABC transporter permease [Corynebacterium bovis]|uniref:ABC transporter permease n=1 Tax=Corynebacterium bovis TaxID=36808 RepID=UPI003CC7207F
MSGTRSHTPRHPDPATGVNGAPPAAGPANGVNGAPPAAGPAAGPATATATDPTTDATTEPVRGTGRWRLYLRRFLRNRTAVVGLVIFAGLIAHALAGENLTHWAFDDPDFLNLSAPPSADHWFGTTEAGNDLLAQTAHGLGRSLIIAVSVSGATSVLSAVIGAGAALYGGAVEKIVLAAIHFLMAVPTFLLIALLVGGSGGDWMLLVVVLVAFGWMYPARVIWSLALTVRENDYVRAASYMGVSRARTVVRHIIPNIGSLLVIQFTLGVVAAVGAETGLSFLGTLLSGGADSLESAPWRFYVPAGVLTLLTVSMAFIADGLRDALDPNSRSGGTA